MSDHNSFIEKCLSGDALLTDIDHYVNEWHASDSSSTLAEYLGMSFDEYTAWIENSEVLRSILFARMKRIAFDDYKTDARSVLNKLAARGLQPAEVHTLEEWLKRTNRL